MKTIGSKDIPVIVISKDNSIASVTKAYQMGASNYIGRPFDAKVILSESL